MENWQIPTAPGSVTACCRVEEKTAETDGTACLVKVLNTPIWIFSIFKKEIV